MALELIKTSKLTIVNLGINLDQDSTQEQLGRALELEPKLNSYIVEITNKSIKNHGKESNKTDSGQSEKK